MYKYAKYVYINITSKHFDPVLLDFSVGEISLQQALSYIP